MLKVKFRYMDSLSKGEWREQECIVSTVDECKKIYGLGKDCIYQILSAEDIERPTKTKPESLDGFEYKGRKYFIAQDRSYDVCFLFDATNIEHWELVEWWHGITINTLEETLQIAKDYIDKPVGNHKIIDLAKKFRQTWYENTNNEENMHLVEDAEHELLDTILSDECEQW